MRSARSRRQVLDRAHVVQAVGELDEDDAQVARHRQQHLAEVLGLLRLAGCRSAARRAWSRPRPAPRTSRPKRFSTSASGDRRVLDHVVQQRGAGQRRVEPGLEQVEQDAAHRHRVGDVGLARGAALRRRAPGRRSRSRRPPGRGPRAGAFSSRAASSAARSSASPAPGPPELTGARLQRPFTLSCTRVSPHPLVARRHEGQRAARARAAPRRRARPGRSRWPRRCRSRRAPAGAGAVRRPTVPTDSTVSRPRLEQRLRIVEAVRGHALEPVHQPEVALRQRARRRRSSSRGTQGRAGQPLAAPAARAARAARAAATRCTVSPAAKACPP